jgi:hypothetical protein
MAKEKIQIYIENMRRLKNTDSVDQSLRNVLFKEGECEK